MKKIIIISLTVIGLGFVSCQKENIAPNSADSLEVPAWENARSGDDDDSGGGDNGTIGAITDPNDDNDNPSDEPPITDPNDDNGKSKANKGGIITIEGGN